MTNTTISELRVRYALEQRALDARQDAEIARRRREREPIREMHRRELRRITHGRTLSASARRHASQLARANVAARIG